MLRYQLIESLPRIILYLYFCSLVDLAGLIRKACREVFDRFVCDLVTLPVIIDPIGTAAIFAALSQSTPPGGRRAMAVRGTAIVAGICVAFAFGGEALLRAMGVSLAVFQAAGGALLRSGSALSPSLAGHRRCDRPATSEASIPVPL